jgi:nucleoside-diphosphate-sugar epimerase
VIAISGAAGRIGFRVGRQLGDARTVPLEHAADLSTADLKAALEGVDTVVHLAFAAGPLRDVARMARTNLDTTRRLLDAAGAVGVRHIVCVSSAMVYGAWEGSPIPLTEEAPVRPNTGATYAVHKAEVERLLAEWKEAHPGSTASILRPAPVLERGRRDWRAKVWSGAVRVRVRGTGPTAQFLHPDDLASAIVLAARRRLDGVYNVAPDGWIPGQRARELLGRPALPLPGWAARRVIGAWWRAGVGRVPPAVLPYLVHPSVVANDRIRAEGWVAGLSNEEALVAGLQPTWWQIVRARPGRVAAIGSGVAGAGAVSAIVAALLVRRRRRN